MRYCTLDKHFQKNSQELLSLQMIQEAPEGLVYQEVQQVQQYRLVPSHQETPRVGRRHKDSADYSTIITKVKQLHHQIQF